MLRQRLLAVLFILAGSVSKNIKYSMTNISQRVPFPLRLNCYINPYAPESALSFSMKALFCSKNGTQLLATYLMVSNGGITFKTKIGTTVSESGEDFNITTGIVPISYAKNMTHIAMATYGICLELPLGFNVSEINDIIVQASGDAIVDCDDYVVYFEDLNF